MLNYTRRITQPQVQSNVGSHFAPKRAGTKTSHVVFVLDDSASMQSCRDATISGYNEYLQAQKKNEAETGIKTFVSLYKFDGTNVDCVINRERVSEVTPLNKESYNPNGMTNLYDGIGGVLMQINMQLDTTKKKKRDSIVITILTDGMENASKLFSSSDIKLMIERAESKDWTFMFLGANIDAFAVGNSLGFGAHNTVQYNTTRMAETISLASSFTNNVKSARSAGLNTLDTYASASISEEDRKKVS